MDSESLKHRISDFLKIYPPFSFLEENELLRLSALTRVQFRKAGEVIFHQGQQPDEVFYVIHQGHVHLTIEEENETTLVESLDEGDIFGIAALLARRLYLFTAKAEEDCILYLLPYEPFKKIIYTHPRILRFFSSGFSAGMHFYHKRNIKTELEDSERSHFSSHDEILKIHISKRVVQCRPDVPVSDAAKIMTEHRVGSILVLDDRKLPLGIITDSDMRKKVATGMFPISSRAEEIMSSPVITASPEITAADAIVMMMRYNIKHIAITEDGTPQSAVCGMVSEHDVLVLHGNNPAVLVKEIEQATDLSPLPRIRDRAEQLLRDYLQQNVSIQFIAGTITEINDALIDRAIDLTIQKLKGLGLELPDERFCWLSLGSEGRKEQLLRTDQDNAIVYADPPPGREEEYERYFLALGREVNNVLISCGFQECPSDIMARNPMWCKPLSVWKEYFARWITVPDDKAVMHTTIFFDLRPVYGDSSLSDELRNCILTCKKKDPAFLLFLARNAISNPPPLNFFRNFIVEKSGSHEDRFDLKARCMMPLADAARLLTISHDKVNAVSTVERYRTLIELEPDHRSIYEEAIRSYGIYMQFRARFGLQNHDSGRYIDPKELDKIDRQTLRNTFSTIEEIQRIVRVRFQLDFLR
jgi:CBS domain-containing protein